MFAYGHYGVEVEVLPVNTAASYLPSHNNRFDALAQVGLLNTLPEVLAALSAHVDERCEATLPDDPAHHEEYRSQWASFKSTLESNTRHPFQQVAAPDRRIYWWVRLV